MKFRCTRLVSLMLALVLLASVLTLPALAAPHYYDVDTDIYGEGFIKLRTYYQEAGEKVTVTAYPDRGYILTSLKVIKDNGHTVDFYTVRRNQFRFVMPYSDVTVRAVFTPAWLVALGALGIFEENEVIPFDDVTYYDWYYDAVRFVYDNGFMEGTGERTFSPNGSLTRGMIAQILYNVEGENRSYASTFSDVPNGKWYADAVNWAAQNDIVHGVGEDKFAPEKAVTRQEMAAIFYRYAEIKGYDMSASASLASYPDAGKVSGWAENAMEWAVGSYLISGRTNGNLDPTGDATRAEVAQIIMWFCSNVL